MHRPPQMGIIRAEAGKMGHRQGAHFAWIIRPLGLRKEVFMIRSRHIRALLLACLAGLVAVSCSKHKPADKAKLAIARETELARLQRETVVQKKDNTEQTERLQTLATIAGRERDSLETRAREFRQQWQNYFVRRAEEQKTYQEMVDAERAGMTERDREDVRVLEEKIKAGQRLTATDEEFAMDRKVLDTVFGQYLLREVRANPARRHFIGLILRRKALLDRAEEEERLGRVESKAHADLAAFALQVKQMKQVTDHIQEGKYDQAVPYLTKALEKSPFVPEFYALRGALYCLARLDLERAVADLDEAQRLNSRDAWVWYCRGLAHWIKGSHGRARADFHEAIQRDHGLASLVRRIDPTGK
jgi:tetratricopeptide (TPR) repeat protein